MSSAQPSPSRQLARIGPAVALGFFGIGLACLGAVLAILLMHPAVLAGDPHRPEAAAFLGLVSIGFVGSFLFGGAYVVSPLMAASSLFSARLALAHLALHAAGLLWLLVVYGGLAILEDPRPALIGGLLLVCAGVALHVVNLYATASQRNRWEPGHVAILLGLFWLAIGAGAGVLALASPWLPDLVPDPLLQAEGHLHILLLGYVWLSLLGLAMKLFHLFLATQDQPAGLSWAGLAVAHAGIALDSPLAHLTAAGLPNPSLALVAIGSLLILADLVRLWSHAGRPIDSTLSGVFAGLVAGVALLGWVVAGSPLPETTGTDANATRALILAGVIGTATVTLVPYALRVVPFVVWRLRCAPRIGRIQVVTPQELQHPSATLAALICLWAAWGHLVASRWLAAPVGTQVAGVCLAIGVLWAARALLPSLNVFVLGPEDESATPGAPTSPTA
jgi:hypothetical protein